MSYRDVLGELPQSPIGRDFDLAQPVESFIPTARAVAFQPVAFFAALPRRGGLGPPLVFALICAEISEIITGIIGLAEGHGVGALIGGIIAAAIGTVIVLFIVAGIGQLLVNAIVGSPNAGFEATFRAAAYAWVTSLVSWIPVIGGLAGLYGLYLAIVGIREMQSTTSGKAAAVVLIPVVVIAVVALIIAAIVGAALFAMMNGF